MYVCVVLQQFEWSEGGEGGVLQTGQVVLLQGEGGEQGKSWGTLREAFMEEMVFGKGKLRILKLLDGVKSSKGSQNNKSA